MHPNGVGFPAPFICYSLIEYVGRLKKDGPLVVSHVRAWLNTGRKKDVRSRKNRWQAVSRCR